MTRKSSKHKHERWDQVHTGEGGKGHLAVRIRNRVNSQHSAISDRFLNIQTYSTLVPQEKSHQTQHKMKRIDHENTHNISSITPIKIKRPDRIGRKNEDTKNTHILYAKNFQGIRDEARQLCQSSVLTITTQ